MQAYDGLPADQALRAQLKETNRPSAPVGLSWSADSTATSLAVFWGETLWKDLWDKSREAGVSIYDYMAERATPEQKLQALRLPRTGLPETLTNWRTPWGQINRFQHFTGDILQPFNDEGEHSRSFHFGTVGVARFIWRESVS